MSNYATHAQTEFRAAGWVDQDGKFKDGMQELICSQVLELLEKFSEHGHTGTTAPYAINMFTKLANFEPLVPLTGEDWEWNEVGTDTYQNKRCSHVFKESKDGPAFDIHGIVFYDWVTNSNGEKFKSHYTSRDSRVNITFPYTPTTEYKERID